MRVVVIGDPAVGKSSLVLRKSKGEFPCEYVPANFLDYSSSVDCDGETVSLVLHDSAGEEDFDILRASHYKSPDAFVICFAVDSKASLASVETKWKPEVDQNGAVPIILVGNKLDLRKSGVATVSPEEAAKVAASIGATYIECSALDGTNVDKVFLNLVRVVKGM